jgi:hypothetical protein
MQQRDPAVHQQANQTGGVQLIRRQLHLSPQRYHQGRCRQGMAEQIFHVPLAPHQSIERMGIALNRGEDRFDHRGDDFGLDCLAQPGLDKGAGNDFAAHIGNLFGAAKFTRHAARGKRACGRALRRLLFVQQHLATAARVAIGLAAMISPSATSRPFSVSMMTAATSLARKRLRRSSSSSRNRLRQKGWLNQLPSNLWMNMPSCA